MWVSFDGCFGGLEPDHGQTNEEIPPDGEFCLRDGGSREPNEVSISLANKTIYFSMNANFIQQLEVIPDLIVDRLTHSPQLTNRFPENSWRSKMQSKA